MFYIRKIELDIDSLKVRYNESLLGFPWTLLFMHTPDPSAQHNLYKLKEDSQTEPANFYVLIVNMELVCFDVVSVEQYDFNTGILCKKKLSNSKIIQSPCFWEV